MSLVRAVRIDDLDALLQLARSATRGLTSLQLSREQLLDRIEQSVFAFSRTGTAPRAEPYVLVMIEDDAIVGTSTVYAKTGGHQPFYAYQRVATEHHSDQLGVGHHRESLQIYRTHDGPTEIGSLFLRSAYRGGGRGRWLSLSRFMLIAMRRNRFANTVIAEMRGRAEPDGRVAFWEAVTGRFIPVEFAVADAMSTMSKDFIEQMMPQHPIYLDLLPADIRSSLGKVHDETLPAVKMLADEGFSETDLVDIFDAGPVIKCETDRIDAVSRSQKLIVESIANIIDDGDEAIIASPRDGFTSIRATVRRKVGQVELSATDAAALDLQPGSPCWLMSPRPN